jgi:hypothetical protein
MLDRQDSITVDFFPEDRCPHCQVPNLFWVLSLTYFICALVTHRNLQIFDRKNFHLAMKKFRYPLFLLILSPNNRNLTLLKVDFHPWFSPLSPLKSIATVSHWTACLVQPVHILEKTFSLKYLLQKDPIHLVICSLKNQTLK